jgi:hypothetical protein
MNFSNGIHFCQPLLLGSVANRAIGLQGNRFDVVVVCQSVTFVPGSKSRLEEGAFQQSGVTPLGVLVSNRQRRISGCFSNFEKPWVLAEQNSAQMLISARNQGELSQRSSEHERNILAGELFT